MTAKDITHQLLLRKWAESVQERIQSGFTNRTLDLNKNPSVAYGASSPYRNHEIPIFLERGFNRALRFGISDSRTFARRCTPSNVVLCLSQGSQSLAAHQTGFVPLQTSNYPFPRPLTTNPHQLTANCGPSSFDERPMMNDQRPFPTCCLLKQYHMWIIRHGRISN